MRLWHYKLLPYLPDAQFKGQLRELVAIKRDWETKGKTNHLLINRVMEYPKGDLSTYFVIYEGEYVKRYNKRHDKYITEFVEFCDHLITIKNEEMFIGWHNKEYLRVCMANLYEKYLFGVGKSRIADKEWQRLLDGYKAITGEEYQI